MQTIKLPATFRAFTSKNYRYYYVGQLISMMGNWMQDVAMAWLAYRLTNSPLLLGLVTVISNLPIMLISPLAGTIVDSYNKKKILFFCQWIVMSIVFLLGILTHLNLINIYLIYILAFLIGCVISLEMPTRQAFLMEIIDDKKNVSNAVALNSSIVHLSRIIGPAIAGVIIAHFGEAPCFFFNAFSFLGVVIALYFINPNSTVITKNSQTTAQKFKEGLRYAWEKRPIKYLLLFTATLSAFGMFYPVLMPVFVKNVLLTDSKSLGILMSSAGVGSIIGALTLATNKNLKALTKNMFFSSIIFGVVIIALAFTQTIVTASICLIFSGALLTFSLGSANSLVQLIVEDQKRGRVMALYTTSFKGIAPIGAFLAGSIASYADVKRAFLFSGIVTIFIAFFYLKKDVTKILNQELKNNTFK